MKKSKNGAIILTLVFVLSISLISCNKKLENDADTKDEKITYQVTVGGEPDNLDPIRNGSGNVSTIAYAAFEGLMKWDTDGTTCIEGQAKSYDISSDELVYSFHLKEGLKWSDGSPLTAHDFVYGWNRAVSSDESDYRYLFQSIESYEAYDDQTLVVTLIGKNPYFLELCALPAFFPVNQKSVESTTDYAKEAESYLSNGAFQLTKWEHNSYLLFEKNENYWDTENIGPDEIKFMLYENADAQIAAYEKGEVVYIENCPVESLKDYKETKDFYTQKQIGTYFVSFNTQNQYLSNPLIRKALTLSVDRIYICEQIGMIGQKPAGAFVPEGLKDGESNQEFRKAGGDYYDPADYERNIELAKEALVEAGFPNGKGLPVFNYLTNDVDRHMKLAESLQSMWAQIGIQINIDTMDWNNFMKARKAGEYDIARNGWMGDFSDPISFLDLWVTNAYNNDAQWSNKEYDELMNITRTSPDVAARTQTMHEAEDLLFDEWVLCPIYYYADSYLLNEKVKGIYSSPLGFKFFDKLEG